MELAIVLKITLPPKAPQIQLCGSLGSWRWNRKSPFLTYKQFVNWHRTTFWEEPRSFHCTGLASYCHSSSSYYHLGVQSEFLFLKLCCFCVHLLLCGELVLILGMCWSFDSRVVEAQGPLAIVIPADGKSIGLQLREGDLSWDDFLSCSNHLSRLDIIQISFHLLSLGFQH
jgi:hypothetical protein